MFKDLKLAEKSRAEGKRETGDRYRRITVPADKVSNQKRNWLSSPSPHLRPDRSTQEDAEDAEDAETKDRLASSGYGRDWLTGSPYDAAQFAGVCCHVSHPIECLH